MDIIKRNFFRLLRSGALGEYERLEPMSDFKWNRLLQLLQAQQVTSIAYKGLKNHQFDTDKTFPPSLLESLERLAAQEVQPAKSATPRLSNHVLNHRLKKIKNAERHAIDTSTETLQLLDIVVDNIAQILNRGISLSGILAFLHLILKYILDQKQRNKTVLLAGCGLWLLYGFPLVLSQYLLVHLFRMTKMRKDQALGLTFVILLFLYPESYVSVSFLIPAAFRLCSHFYPRRKSVSLFISLLLQGWFFHGMDPVVSLVYLFVRPLLGFVYLVSLLYLLIPVSLFSQIVFFIDRSLSLFSYFHLPGSIAGAGLLFFLVMIFSMRRLKHASFYMLAVLLVFQCFGLFHPFASVSFINVGQGDAILIKGPLRSFSVLVDTGKPAQWRTLSAFLEGEGIRKLDALIITHGDNDHAGNMDAVM